MKVLLFLWALTLSSLSFGQSHVEDFKADGWFGDTDLLDRAEEFIGFGGYCEKATRAEFDYIESKTPTVNIENSNQINTQRGFDNWSEELIFTSTAQKIQQQSSCQNKLFQGLAQNKGSLTFMRDHALYQFRMIEDRVRKLVVDQDVAQENLDQVKANTSYREDKYSARNQNYWQDQKEKRSSELNEVKADIALAFSRLPLGNRQEMKKELLELFKRNEISDYQFRLAFDKAVGILREQARKSNEFFEGIKDKKNENLYWIDEDLKKSFVQSGAVSNLIEGFGMEEELQNKFSCRANARYKRGANALLMAEIPLYFTGMYGLGRAALAMGAKYALTGTKLAKTALLTSRGAMLGLDAYAYARIADEIRQVCWKDEYTAAIQNGSCNFESEVSGVFQEASFAQCATMSVLGFGPITAMTAMKVATPIRQFLKTKKAAPDVYAEPVKIPANSPEVARHIPKVNSADVAYEPLTISVTGSRSKKNSFFISKSELRRLDQNKSVQRILESDDFMPEVAGKLSDKERVYIIERVANVAFTKKEALRIINAHKRGTGYGQYTFADLRFKRNELYAVLVATGKTDSEAKLLINQMMRKGVIGKASKLEDIAKIQDKLMATRKSIEGKKMEVSSGFKDSILKNVPENLKAGFSKAIDDMQNTKKLADYFEDLQKDTFAKMLRSEDKNLNMMASNGNIDANTMIAILKKRVKDNDAKIETITDSLSSEEFNKVIGKGYIIDNGFTEASRHGVYTHLIQQDYTYNIIAKTSNVKHSEIIDFFGTPEGMKVWDEMFDLQNSNSSFSPEYFKPEIMKENIPLGFTPKPEKKRYEKVA